MALEFSDMTAAGRWGDTCEFPVLDLRPLLNDGVLSAIPRFLYRWEDDHTMGILLDDRFDYIEAEDECDFVEARRETMECTVIMPNQKEIMVGEKNVKFEKLMRRFCNAQKITKFPTLFNSDGTLDMGQALAGPFIDFLLAELRAPMMQRLINSAWTGDQANDNHMAGILTQLLDPTSWVDSGVACNMYRPNVLDWNVAVAGAGAASAPGAEIAAGQDTYIIMGQTFAGLTGANLVTFLKLYMERLLEYELSRWSDESIEFELWVPLGQTNCIAELAACMQPCEGCVNPLSDPMIRQRASEFQRDKVIWLYPYDQHKITIRTSPQLKNRMIFVPKTVGGKPMIGWVFRDQDEELAIVNGRLPFYGAQTGLPNTNDLYPDPVGPIDGGMFEERAFSLHIQRNGDCLDFWIKESSAILVFGLHMWMILDNVTCTTLTPDTIQTVMSFAVDAEGCVEDDAHTLTLTVTALDGNTAYTNDGDIWSVHWADGQVLIATVGTAGWDDLTDALTLVFPASGPEVSCSLSSDVASTNAPAFITYKGPAPA